MSHKISQEHLEEIDLYDLKRQIKEFKVERNYLNEDIEKLKIKNKELEEQNIKLINLIREIQKSPVKIFLSSGREYWSCKDIDNICQKAFE